jgi:hypothetical protein
MAGVVGNLVVVDFVAPEHIGGGHFLTVSEPQLPA